MSNNILAGDNLHHLSKMSDFEVDLIYLDPPFNSGKNKNLVVANSIAQEEAYKDTWVWGAKAKEEYLNFISYTPIGAAPVSNYLTFMKNNFDGTSILAYLVMMAPRLWECARVLKLTGSLWLHCDPSACHYLKVLLDLIFGSDNFRAQVIWKRTSAHNNASQKPGAIHDVLLFYTKSGAYTWNPVYHVASQKFKDRWEGIDLDGRKWLWKDVMGPGVSKGGNSVLPWRGIDPTKAGKGRAWQVGNSNLKENYFRLTGKELIGTSQEMLDKAYEAELIRASEKNVSYKHYIDEDEEKGVILQNIWGDIPPLVRSSKEFADLDGQKPLALIKRVIEASSNKGDLVLDPFLGSGTTAIAAQQLGRRWIGIELTTASAQKAIERLDLTFGKNCWLNEFCFDPADIEEAKKLASQDKLAFQDWVVLKLGGVPRSGHDRGIDGDYAMPAYGFADNKSRKLGSQVKGGTVTMDHIKAFCHSIRKEELDVGWFIVFKDRSVSHLTDGMLKIAEDEGFYTTGFEGDNRKSPRIEVLYIEDLFDRNIVSAGSKIPAPIVRQGERYNLALAELREKKIQQSAFNLMWNDLPQEE